MIQLENQVRSLILLINSSNEKNMIVSIYLILDKIVKKAGFQKIGRRMKIALFLIMKTVLMVF